MTDLDQPDPGEAPRAAGGRHTASRPGRPPTSTNGLPTWLTIIVVLVLLALLAWNIVRVGPEGLGTTYVLGGLLGAYAGVDQLLKRRPPGDGGA